MVKTDPILSAVHVCISLLRNILQYGINVLSISGHPNSVDINITADSHVCLCVCVCLYTYASAYECVTGLCWGGRAMFE